MPIKVENAMSTSSHAVNKPTTESTVLLGAGGKELPAPYKSSGNEALDTMAFLHMLEQLKVGATLEAVPNPRVIMLTLPLGTEAVGMDPRGSPIARKVNTASSSKSVQVKLKIVPSISDHMCRMALMAMMIPTDPARPLDIPRCVMMALVHDLAEAYVGDITPVEGVPAHVKHQLEDQAMDSFLNEMLGSEGNKEARERFRSLWDEYEARQTPESKLVKDLDRIELALQAVEYERSQDITTLHPFFKGSIPPLEHPTIQKWAETLLEERRKLWTSRGKGEEEQEAMRGCVPGSQS